MLKKRLGFVFVVVGAALLIAALLLFLYNEQESATAGEAASSALSAMQDMIPDKDPFPAVTLPDGATEPPEETIPEPTELTRVNIDGNDYIGYISIPGLELDLPIMADCTESKLRVAPCLQYGSPLTDDAVIAGHSYRHHFRPLHDLELEDRLAFTDMTGYTIAYEVVKIKYVEPTAVYEVINSEYDLVLYTCTNSGRSRIVIGCNRIEDDVDAIG